MVISVTYNGRGSVKSPDLITPVTPKVILQYCTVYHALRIDNQLNERAFREKYGFSVSARGKRLRDLLLSKRHVDLYFFIE